MLRRLPMGSYNTTDPPRRDQALVTAAEWFGVGQRIPYDPESARVLTEEEAAATPGALRVFERVTAAEQDADTVWLTLLPGFPDGSYAPPGPASSCWISATSCLAGGRPGMSTSVWGLWPSAMRC